MKKRNNISVLILFLKTISFTENESDMYKKLIEFQTIVSEEFIDGAPKEEFLYTVGLALTMYGQELPIKKIVPIIDKSIQILLVYKNVIDNWTS